MLKKQFIAILFAGVLMANMGHNIVPHHHHFDSILFHQGCQEHDEDNTAFHTGDPTSHCHAFNGIEYYPAPEKQNISKPFKTAKYICLSQVIELNQAISHQGIFRPSRGSPPVYTYLLGTSTGLRAPPMASLPLSSLI
jgi:hypothetical protein